MRLVGYNSQRDNFDFGGQFRGSCQCFSTAAWMFISYIDPKFKANDDISLRAYVDDVSDIVGKPGIGEKIKKAYRFISGNSAYWWQVHKAALEARLGEKVVFRDGDMSEAEFVEAVMRGPVIIGTNKMAGLPGGHIILATDRDRYNDPYGNARTGYRDRNGANVEYPLDWIRPFIEYNKGNKIRAIHL